MVSSLEDKVVKIPKMCRNGDGRAFVIIPKSGGTRRYLGVYGTPEAEQAYKQWVNRLLAGEDPNPSSSQGILVLEVIDTYLDYAESYYQKDGATTREYRGMSVALQHLGSLFGSQPITSIGAKQLKTYVDHVASLPFKRNGKNIGLSRGYVNRNLERVKRFIGWAEVEGYVEKGTHEHVKLTPGLKRGKTQVRDPEPVQPVSWETLTATLPHLNPLIADMTRVQFLCGMRPQDVIGLRWDLIDESGDVWFYQPEQHKGSHRGQSLVKAIPRAARDILENYRHREGKESIFCPKEAILRQRVESYGHVSCRLTVGRNIRESYTNATYGKAVSDGCRRAVKAGSISKKWSPNQLRHGVATLLRSRLSPDHARAYLGHKGFDATEIYAGMDRKTMQDVAASLDSFVSPLRRESDAT